MGPIFVTGAGGNIGRATVKKLEQDSFEVIAGVRKNIAYKMFLEADLVDDPQLLDTLPDDLSAIVHMASFLPLGTEEDAYRGQLNTILDNNVFNFALKRKIPVIYGSSCGLYPDEGKSFKNENSETEIISPYFRSKKNGEEKFLSLGNGCVLRICAPISPFNKNSIAYRFTDIARQGKVISLHGTGTREQDFIDSRDIASFVSLALKRRLTGIFNIASGTPITMRDLATCIIKVLNSGKWEFSGLQDAQEHRRARFDIIKAKNVGWKPEIPLSKSIQDILKEILKDEATQ